MWVIPYLPGYQTLPVRSQAWFYGEGLKLPVEMQYDMTLTTQAYELATRWDASRTTEDTSRLNFEDSDLKEFNSNQIGMSYAAIN